jgi:nucleotidyltransferase/DNA polymerase involved in DNA repair
VRKILHCDMDAFFAAVEQRDDPARRRSDSILDVPLWSGGGRSEYQAAFRKGTASMLARASAGVR